MFAIHNVTAFIIEFLFSIYSLLLILRILLEFFQASIHNPICQFIAKFTDPVVLPFHGVLPTVKFFDLSSVLVLLILHIIKYIILGLLLKGILFSFIYILIIAVVDIVVQVLDLLFYAIIIRVILDWVSPTANNPFTQVIILITEPILKLFRRFIPLISGFDLSPLFTLICLKIIAIIILSVIPVSF